MLAETRQAMLITTTAFDLEIAGLLKAAAGDLRLAGVPVKGVAFTISGSTVTDTSTITDPLLMRALITYVRARFGNPANYEQLKAAYDEQKAQLISATGYGIPEED